MNKYFVTFGQKDISRRNGFFEIEAIDYNEAMRKAKEFFGRDFSMLYDEDDFDASYFPKGCLNERK